MLATTADAPLQSEALVYEPKYDGIRAITLAGPSASARLWSRLGNEKTKQFPEIVEALDAFAGRLDRPVILDGEIVALDAKGQPTGFQNLQGRIHLKATVRNPALRVPAPALQARSAAAHDPTASMGGAVAYIAFDLLQDGGEDLRAQPLHERRRRLEALLRGVRDSRLRISEQVAGDARELQKRAESLGWEGLIAKAADSPYTSGRRSPHWRKLKLVRHQTCVVGGWTEPRGSRPFLGALLLGVYDDAGRLHYVGHTGAGFSDAELGRVWKKLQALKVKTSPFAVAPRTNERPSWVRPRLVAEVKFTEWTADGKLRHPTYLGLRDDVRPETVRKEPESAMRKSATSRKKERAVSPARPAAAPPRAAAAPTARRQAAQRPAKSSLTKAAVSTLLDQLDAIQESGGNGVLELPGGDTLEVSNLRKPFWPALQLTKGDLFRHYVRVAPFLLPVLADRPLVMKRYPNGVAAKPFYQHRAPDKVPPAVRVETVGTETERRLHLIGGSLVTLLYTAQLASISQDPWFSRVGAEEIVDHVAIDLDPPDDMPFGKVLDVARWVRDALDVLKAPGFPKTSGSGGLHVYVPMPPATPYGAGLLFCQIVATMVAKKHPRAATIERSIAARGNRIYVDFLQNIQGKTLASAYSARANDFAGVSTPLTWDEVDAGVSPRDFTVVNFAARLESVGDLWAGLRKSRGVDLRGVEKYARENKD